MYFLNSVGIRSTDSKQILEIEKKDFGADSLNYW